MTTTLPTLFTPGWPTDATAIINETYVAQKVVGGTQYSVEDTTPRPSTINVISLAPNSRVKISRVDTGAFLGQVSSGAFSSVTIQVPYSGPVNIEARNASGSPAYKPWVTLVSVSSTATTIVTALQEQD
jgi:hypothetical protein